MAPPTILTHKSAFLTAQTLQLSRNLAPSNAWRASNDRSEHALSERALDDALYRLNHTLQQHARRVYPQQATRHVAEQIEALFLDAGDAAAGDDDDEDGDGAGSGGAWGEHELREGVDLTSEEAIAVLPPTWESHRPADAEAHPSEARRYGEFQETLTSLSTRRAEAKARVARLRHMQTLLDPFKSGVQENLVTRNGEVEQELERMRMLLLRVAGRVSQLPDTQKDQREDDTIMEDVDEAERRKVRNLLQGM